MTRGGPSRATLTVYYDGACPLCSREIASYRRRSGAETIDWIDVARCNPEALGPGLERDAALARIHVREPDGTLVDGAAAFAALWQRLPAFAWLGRIAHRPLVLPLLEYAYSAFLRTRRLWRTPDEALPRALVADLRTDHAGEAGAVMIYRGVLAVSRDAAVRGFATRHLYTESRHLASIEAVLPARQRSRLLPLWRAAGWLTGALPALVGPRAVYATVEAVETFVDRHYAEQIERIDRAEASHRDPAVDAVRALLAACREDELAHRDDAAQRLTAPPGVALRLWSWLVGAGSAAAVRVSRKV